MGWAGALIEALELEQRIGDALTPTDLEMASRCDGWSVRQVLDHSIGVTRKFTLFASGATDAPRTPVGDQVGPDHHAALRDTVVQARLAWASTDLRRTCQLSFGSFPAEVAAGINLFDVLAHSWDVAAAAGRDLDEHDALWTTGLDAARAVIGRGRDARHYAPERPAPEEAPAMTRFLAFVGRT